MKIRLRAFEEQAATPGVKTTIDTRGSPALTVLFQFSRELLFRQRSFPAAGKASRRSLSGHCLTFCHPAKVVGRNSLLKKTFIKISFQVGRPRDNPRSALLKNIALLSPPRAIPLHTCVNCATCILQPSDLQLLAYPGVVAGASGLQLLQLPFSLQCQAFVPLVLSCCMFCQMYSPPPWSPSVFGLPLFLVPLCFIRH